VSGSGATGAGTTRTRLPRAERVQQTLAAAARAFARSGYAATSMDEIAAEAGISKLMIYRDFEGKRQLYEAILEAAERRLYQLVAHDPYKGASDQGLVALLRLGREQPDGFKLVFQQAAREPEFAAYADRFTAEAIRTGERRLAEEEIHDPAALRWAARVSFRLSIEAVIAWLEVGDPSRDEAFLAALRTLSGQPGRLAYDLAHTQPRPNPQDQPPQHQDQGGAPA
jgi:AcrR family transcriptional regulator